MTAISDTLREKLSTTTTSPGVYLMKDAQGKIIYVGKARNLKKRLSSYFLKSSPPDVKTAVLVENIVEFETILTATEHEALILESNLIKRHRPRYNVILKDDKRYPILRLDVASPYPMLTLVRKIEKDDALYFGPFSSAGAVQQTLRLINRMFMLRKCRGASLKTRSRPCLNCQMNQCLAPCCRDVPPEEYGEIVREVILFLSGKTTDLISKIKQEMTVAAERQNFEKAAILRDKVFALQKVLERQVVVTTERVDRDILGIATRDRMSIITLLFVRNGTLVGTRHFHFPDTISNDVEMVESFLTQYYERSPFVPSEVLLPLKVENQDVLETRLAELRSKKVRILSPRRGEKKKMIAMAMENARNRLDEEIQHALSGKRLLERLKVRLSLSDFPVRIECFDNSNLYGTHSVSGMVVFENGKPKKSAYRKFELRNVASPDDYASMAEVLTRRFQRLETSDPLPNLLMVDGGRGQLNIALSVLKSNGLYGKMDVLGIAKKEPQKGETNDKIFLPGRTNPVVFGKDADLLLFLQSVRDEAHRFAISFYRKKHRSKSFQSKLDEIPGIGEKRRQTLLTHFRSIHRIGRANVSEIAALPGFNKRVAERVIEVLRNL